MVCSIIFRGRENAHVDEGFKLVTRLVGELADVAKVEQNASDDGPADRGDLRAEVSAAARRPALPVDSIGSR